MRRLRHYAFDVPAQTTLPPGCKWVRVTDFDPLGMLAAYPYIGTLGNPGLAVQYPGDLQARAPITPAPVGGFSAEGGQPLNIGSGLVHPVFEPAQMRLDGNVITVDNFLAQHGSGFKTVELRGNLEVEYSEGEDFPGMVKGSGVVQAPFYFTTAQMQNAPLEFWLPKGTREISLFFALPNAANVGITHIAVAQMWQVPNGSSGVFPNTPRTYTIWDAGSTWQPKTDRGMVIGATFYSLDSVAADPGFGAALTLNLTTAAAPMDDAANREYTRVWAPSPGLSIHTSVINTALGNGYVECLIFGMLTIEV